MHPRTLWCGKRGEKRISFISARRDSPSTCSATILYRVTNLLSRRRRRKEKSFAGSCCWMTLQSEKKTQFPSQSCQPNEIVDCFLPSCNSLVWYLIARRFLFLSSTLSGKKIVCFHSLTFFLTSCLFTLALILTWSEGDEERRKNSRWTFYPSCLRLGSGFILVKLPWNWIHNFHVIILPMPLPGVGCHVWCHGP